MKNTVLVVDDSPSNVALLTELLESKGHRVRAVQNGELALQVAATEPPDVVLLDINMPGMNGFEVCRRLKATPDLRAIPVIFLSALTEPMDKVSAFASGGVDYVTKPFQLAEVNARVEAHARLRSLQQQLERYNRELESLVAAQVHEISESQVATILALTRLAESRDEDTGNHIARVQHYCKALAMRLARTPGLAPAVDSPFVDNIFRASPLHDIGKVAIPDRILLKRGPLTADERREMEAHTVIGADTLEAVRTQYPNNAFINLGIQIARSHHERWDGTGYPEGLRGEAIPLGARIVLLADQYDALRSARPYKPALSHDVAVRILLEGDARTRPEHFDPRVLSAFADILEEFAVIHDRLAPAPLARPNAWVASAPWAPVPGGPDRR